MTRSQDGNARAVVCRDARASSATTEALQAIEDAIPIGRTACVAVVLGSAVAVQPDVLSATVDWLTARGVASTAVVAIVPCRDRDAGWDAASLAAHQGWRDRFVIDAWSDTRPAQTGDGHVISGHRLCEAWQTAALRIVIAPCATDIIDGHTLALAALRDLPPTIAGADAIDVVCDLLQRVPPHLTLVDATVTSDGVAGSAVRRPVHTQTVIASTSAPLADLVGATLLGTDPMRSRLLSGVVPVVGLPGDFEVAGDLSPWPDIVYPPEQVLRATRGLDPAVARVLDSAVVQDVGAPDPDDIVMAYLRRQLQPYLGSDDRIASIVLPATGASVLAGYVAAFRTTFAKDSIPRQAASLGLDLRDYSARDYEAAESALSPLLQLIRHLPDDREGMRWTHIDGSVVFEVSRVVPAPFDSWIERVDVAEAISMMADYLGGCRVSVARDKSGRTTRQAERNLYLPQPNYASFSGGRVIDVCKLSVIRRRADAHEIWWRTVRSPNDSAVHDDGNVTFADVGEGRTLIVVRGRQQFALPPALEALDLDLQPQLRDSLTTDAYRRFFSTTLDNFEARYEGRDFAIGRPPDADLPTRGWSRMVRLAGSTVKDWLGASEGASVRVGAVDGSGFTHIAGSRH